jgi:hypothetical protein
MEKCFCGRKKSDGARSCRKCFEAGKGVKPGPKGRSIFKVLDEVRALNLSVGDSVVREGMRFTRTAKGYVSS